MTQSLDQALQAFAPALPLGVAFSGGADSTALLAACVRRWPAQVVALHVNHGLQGAAADFEQHCRRACERLHVPLRVASVDASAAAGESPEAAARTARYQSIVTLARMDAWPGAIQSIAIAQHADDQVETLLLALSRGAGLGGLSAMPAHWQRDGLDFYRPLLRVPAASLREWLALHDEPFVEDPTNGDEGLTRNRIRARLMPALVQAFPHFRDTFARSAAHAAQAQRLLDELARIDRNQVCRERDGLPRIRGLQELHPDRRANLLRYWLKTDFQAIPSAAQLQALLDQVQACETRGHDIHLKVCAGFVRRRGEVLAWYNP